MTRVPALCSTLLAAAVVAVGCSPATPGSPPAPAASRTADGGEAPPQEPAPPAPAAGDVPQSADEWCRSVYTRAGVVDYVLGLDPDVTDDGIRGSAGFSDGGPEIGHALMCSGYGVMLVTGTYANAAVAQERRALTAGISAGEPDRIAGHDGEYFYSEPDQTGGGFGFTWQSDLQDFNATFLLPGVSVVPEDEARDVLAELVTAMSQLPVPEPRAECLDAEESVTALAAAHSDGLSLTEEGIDAVSDLVVELRDQCGYDVAQQALSTLGEPEYVMGEIYDALGEP